ncbi:ribosomal protein S18 acetylase RimI-like enzyme [Rhizobium azibense]|uniref:Ribosomal protein S18 acetylase RimI-like enzyme n=2 Tax=Rhizobium azibense TaxID=1136135 RepID=A0A4R3QWX4_9HYPH|nr:ribosomal protein S18 acetylase RimI-like enzyme [Rhizobium azibense]
MLSSAKRPRNSGLWLGTVFGLFQIASMDYTVRNSRPSDNGQLGEIYLDERRRTFTWVDPGNFRHGDFLAHSQGEIVFVAEAGDGDIAGFMTLWAADDFIHMLYIRKQWQGRGIGTALLKALPGWPRRQYRLKCLINNTSAKTFYAGRGFVVTGSGTSAEGDYEELSFIPA